MRDRYQLRLSRAQMQLFDVWDRTYPMTEWECKRNQRIAAAFALGTGDVSRGKMEFTIQKSIELGVNVITPLFSARCGVKLEASGWKRSCSSGAKSLSAHYEQCGRNRPAPAEIRPAMTLEAQCAKQHAGLKLNLHPRAEQRINTRPLPADNIRLVIRPEGGLSAEEIALTANYRFTDILCWGHACYVLRPPHSPPSPPCRYVLAIWGKGEDND